ncbi:hypothetical protein [Enterobacter cloacae]|uniref:hypothetical protein n=1 Tax=Enterobacter cloacae TaxID=550 RepID=UPI00300F0785
MIKRGFSYSEIHDLPVPLFIELEWFDRVIEPSSIEILDAMFARLNTSIYAASGNLSKEGLRKLKSSDFKLFRGENIFKTPEEIEKEKIQRKRNTYATLIADMPPELIKKMEQEKISVKNKR